MEGAAALTCGPLAGDGSSTLLLLNVPGLPVCGTSPRLRPTAMHNRRLQCEGRRQSGPFPVDKAAMGGSGAVPAGTVEGALRNGISFYEGLQVL